MYSPRRSTKYYMVLSISLTSMYSFDWGENTIFLAWQELLVHVINALLYLHGERFAPWAFTMWVKLVWKQYCFKHEIRNFPLVKAQIDVCISLVHVSNSSLSLSLCVYIINDHVYFVVQEW